MTPISSPDWRLVEQANPLIHTHTHTAPYKTTRLVKFQVGGGLGVGNGEESGESRLETIETMANRAKKPFARAGGGGVAEGAWRLDRRPSANGIGSQRIRQSVLRNANGGFPVIR